MKCPIDQDILTVSDRGGIEIDYCPSCRGVWLDRGELDKIIERSSPTSKPIENNVVYRDNHQNQHKKKRESFLSELFDF